MKKTDKGKNTYTVYETRTQLSKILREVEQGAEVCILRGHTPIAKIVPLQPAATPRRPGSAKGSFVIGEDFDAPLPADVLAAFLR